MKFHDLKASYLQGCHKHLLVKFPDLYKKLNYFSLTFENNFTDFSMAHFLSNVTLIPWDKSTVHNIDRLEYFLSRKLVTGHLRYSELKKVSPKQGLVEVPQYG